MGFSVGEKGGGGMGLHVCGFGGGGGYEEGEEGGGFHFGWAGWDDQGWRLRFGVAVEI